VDEPEGNDLGELEARFPDSVGEVEPGQLEGLPESEAEFVAAFESHSGPLPNRQWFEAVERIHPGATAMIIKDYTDERAHQRQMQMEALRVDEGSLGAFARYQLVRLGIVGALAALFALSGFALIVFDKPIYGFVLLVGEIAAVALAFFGRRRDADDGTEGEGLEAGPI
jgi:hypothetical protein